MPKIYGIALTKEGDPVAGVAVGLTDADGESRGSHTTTDDGIFQFDVVPGTWNVHWTTPNGETNEGQIEVGTDEDAELELEIA